MIYDCDGVISQQLAIKTQQWKEQFSALFLWLGKIPHMGTVCRDCIYKESKERNQVNIKQQNYTEIDNLIIFNTIMPSFLDLLQTFIKWESKIVAICSKKAL